MEAVCERWLWQQGGKDVNQGARGLIFMGYRAKKQQHRPWLSQAGRFGEQTSPPAAFGDRISWLAATRGCPAPAPEPSLVRANISFAACVLGIKRRW